MLEVYAAYPCSGHFQSPFVVGLPDRKEPLRQVHGERETQSHCDNEKALPLLFPSGFHNPCYSAEATSAYRWPSSEPT